jgi:microcin C transport system substrate-binding protein
MSPATPARPVALAAKIPRMRQPKRTFRTPPGAPMPRRISALLLLGFLAISTLPGGASAQETSTDEGVVTSHAIAMHGEPLYPADFKHFAYVNPDAPKGGTLVLPAVGSFDTFNQYTLKGSPAAGLGLAFETLMTSSSDEAFTEYGLIAQTITVPADRSWVEFALRPEARWHDGEPITSADVVFTFDTLMAHGHPFFRAYYGSVAKAEALDEHRVRFTFVEGENRELPLIMGQMPVLPKHYWEGRDFEAPTLEPPLGSGPYRIESFEGGRTITYEKVADWWGADLPINVGQYNWGEVRFEYYRDDTVSLEAFKAGQYDFRAVNQAKEWATAYDIPQVADGRIVAELIPNEDPTGMQGFIFNTRRDLFSDPRVREAIALAYDFEWANQTLFNGQYTRTESYFSNTELASSGLPQGEELEILETFRGRIPDEVFTTEFKAPVTDGSGNNRANLRQAADLLKAAGWVVKNGVLSNEETGKPFKFEILLNSPTFERIVLPFAQNLKKLGIDASVRTVDTSQYQNRMDAFDFDMVVGGFGQSLSPGNEQRSFWASEAADIPGSRNIIGIKDPVIDELIELIIAAPTRESLIARTRALDRVLLWNFYVVPNWHIQADRVAYWNKFGRPEIPQKYNFNMVSTWWIDPAKAAALAGQQTDDSAN